MRLNKSDTLHLEAAKGWLSLGESAEAEAELANIDPRKLSDYWHLDLLWTVHRDQQNWAKCLDISASMAKCKPMLPEAMLCRSQALHKLGRTAEAWKTLRPIAKHRPTW